MRLVAARKAVIDVACIDELAPNTHSVAITFDDALQNFAENVVPVLVGWKIPASVFVVPDALGSKPAWGEGYYDLNERIMSEAQLSSLPDLITVGSHTLTHANLTAVSQESAAEELKLSREKLEAMIRRPILFFSFPHGAFNELVVHQCREAGYKRVFTTEPLLISAAKDQFVVGRVSADPWDWRLEFYLKISGAYCWQPCAQAVVRSVRRLFVTK